MWHHSWGCEPIAWLLPSCAGRILCSLKYQYYGFCYASSTVLPHNSASFLIHILVTIMLFYTPVLLIQFTEKKKQKQNKHIFRGQWDSLVCQYASISWSGSYWTSRVFNGFLEIQLWGHLERQYCGKLKCKPTGSLCSQENNHSMFCFTHSQKENSDLGTKGWRYWEIYIYIPFTPNYLLQTFFHPSRWHGDNIQVRNVTTPPPEEKLRFHLAAWGQVAARQLRSSLRGRKGRPAAKWEGEEV